MIRFLQNGDTIQGDIYRRQGLDAQLYKNEEEKRLYLKSLRTNEMRPVMIRKASIPELLSGKRDEYKLVPLVIGMSGRDALLGPIVDFVVGGKGLNALAKTSKFVYNSGKIILRSLPYNSHNFYRGVGKTAIEDAKATGIIRGSGNTAPYFGLGKPYWDLGYVIEGTHNPVNWLRAKGPRGEYDLTDFVKVGETAKSGYTGVEAFPWNGTTTQVPTTGFSYWKKYPIIGWRNHQFKKGGKTHRPFGHRSILDNGWQTTKQLKDKKNIYGKSK